MYSKEVIGLANPVVKAIKKISREKWEWKPEERELCFLKEEIYISGDTISIDEELTVVRGLACQSKFDVRLWVPCFSESYCFEKEDLIPFLPWQKIEQILEGMGYKLWVEKHSNSGFTCTVAVKTDEIYERRVCRTQAKSRQLAVMRAVIKLAKEPNHE